MRIVMMLMVVMIMIMHMMFMIWQMFNSLRNLKKYFFLNPNKTLPEAQRTRLYCVHNLIRFYSANKSWSMVMDKRTGGQRERCQTGEWYRKCKVLNFELSLFRREFAIFNTFGPVKWNTLYVTMRWSLQLKRIMFGFPSAMHPDLNYLNANHLNHWD